jgi:uncharacterized protein
VRYLLAVIVALLLIKPLGARTMTSLDAALIAAADRGDVTSISDLLAKGASVAGRDARNRTALLAATQGNHIAVARALIEAGADVNAQDNQRDSAVPEVISTFSG